MNEWKVILPVVDSSAKTRQKDKAGSIAFNEPAMQILENSKTRSADKRFKRHSSRKRKTNCTSSSS